VVLAETHSEVSEGRRKGGEQVVGLRGPKIEVGEGGREWDKEGLVELPTEGKVGKGRRKGVNGFVEIWRKKE
jgi:hypothetical protein